MNEFSDTEILAIARELLTSTSSRIRFKGNVSFSDDQCIRIASDGSTRRFWRVYQEDVPLCVIAAPAGTSENELSEARAAWKIGAHLFAQGVGVPEPYGWDPDSGTLLFEDLGDTRLHDLIASPGQDQKQRQGHDELISWYRRTLENLLVMQLHGVKGFDSQWCWDTPRYDVQLMLEKESNYFLTAFWAGIMQREVDGKAREEFSAIAGRAGEISADYFLHRDFQSRNIMVKDGEIRFIDYQGGRFGPLAYDVASLLIDPYSGLSVAKQDHLLDYYFDSLNHYLTVDKKSFMQQYALLAFQRNLQIVGAFSFLYTVRGKEFFKDFIRPALKSLHLRLQDQFFSDYPYIRTMVENGIKDLVLNN